MSDTKKYTCHVGLMSCESGHSGIFVESPRTHRRIVVWRPWFQYLPDRLPGKIAQAAALGKQSIEFTVDELKELVNRTSCCPATPPTIPGNIRYWGKRLDSHKRIARMRNVGH